MNIDYKKELESASKSMIMIHDPRLLIKLIVRMIVRKLKLKHAGMVLYDLEKNIYVLDISRGELGQKLPAGYACFTSDSPLIRLFSEKEFKSLTLNRSALLLEDIAQMLCANPPVVRDILSQIDEQMRLLNTAACVPAYYQNKLMAILLLGEKKEASRFEQEELDFFSALASDATMAIRNAQLFESLKKEAKRNRELFLKTMIVLASLIEAKDEYTRGHIERVTKYSLAIARQMIKNTTANFSEEFTENLYIAGMLHDIGKIGTKESILNKHGKLTAAEYEIMKQHTVRGAEIIRPLSLAKECIDGILYHHENFDGTGYPHGLKGADIPMSAAIIAVADTFDAITSDRPYRRRRSREVAVEVIEKGAGQQFNPLVVKALLELYTQGQL